MNETLKNQIMNELQNVAYFDLLVKKAEERKLEKPYFIALCPYWEKRLYYSQVRLEAFDFAKDKYHSDEVAYYVELGRENAYTLLKELDECLEDVDLLYLHD